MKTEEQIKARIETLRELLSSSNSNEIEAKLYFECKIQLLEWVLED